MVMVALLVMGSAILLFSCQSKQEVKEEQLDNIKTEESENLTIVMSENGRKSYLFEAKLLEGYTLGRDPYREFRKGISITTYQDDSLSKVNAVLVANYAIYYENRKLWEAKGDVVVTKHDGTRLYTQQLFWNSMTKRIYSNVDTKLVTPTDEIIGEGFESDEEMTQPRFRHWKGRLQFNADDLQSDSEEGEEESASVAPKKEEKPTPATSPQKRTEAPKKVEKPTGTPPTRSQGQQTGKPGRPTPSRMPMQPLTPGGEPLQPMQKARAGKQFGGGEPVVKKPGAPKEVK